MLNIVLICDSHELWATANAVLQSRVRGRGKGSQFTDERDRIFLQNIGRVNFTKYGTFFKVPVIQVVRGTRHKSSTSLIMDEAAPYTCKHNGLQ